MVKILEYTLLFVLSVLFQVLIFDNIQISPFLNLPVYIVFIILLPMESKPVAVLLLSALLGMTIDILIGTIAVNTISATALGFFRSSILSLFVGKEEIGDGGTPSASRLGFSKFLKYSLASTIFFNLIFCFVEVFSFDYFFTTIFRVILSSVFTTLLIYFTQMLFSRGREIFQ